MPTGVVITTGQERAPNIKNTTIGNGLPKKVFQITSGDNHSNKQASCDTCRCLLYSTTTLRLVHGSSGSYSPLEAASINKSFLPVFFIAWAQFAETVISIQPEPVIS